MSVTPAFLLKNERAEKALAAWPWAERLLPVLEDAESRRLVGVVTRVKLANAPKDATVARVMNPAPLVIHGEDDYDAVEAVMRGRNLTAVPVVTADGELEGMVRIPLRAHARPSKWEPVVKAGWIGVGAALGAGAMFLLDPNRGKARRAMLRDKTASWIRHEEEALGKAWRHLTNNVTGVESELKHLFECDEADDAKLTGRVRSKLGRSVSHPRDVEVLASHGHVTLRGKVDAKEAAELEAAVRAVRGVREVENQVAVH